MPIMRGLWIRIGLFVLVALGTAAALRCYSCEDEENESCPQLDCAPGQDRCRATAMASLRPLTRTAQWVRTSRGCDVAGKPNNSVSFASTTGSVLFLSEHFCASDLCNREDPRVSGSGSEPCII
ncbi:hypothetical protein Y1Q_0016046 [Alligator mississippiensis]|uniref:UPAR/Ly6 domain-containing protein n=1 Tax=Alligator mississippiensis TaxID=8496 RepID=A0A151NAH8_ALLMI|nr:hypothetical protein Y1Q_0016046 [Alligator mississippiensis]